MDFFPEIEINAVQAETMARGLYAVAEVDGVHERELALISDLYHAAAAYGSSEIAIAVSLATLSPLQPDQVRAVLVTPELRSLFVKTAMLLAWADGHVSQGEKAKIGEFARALEVSPEEQDRLAGQVKDYLLRPFATLVNVQAAAEVAKKLGM